MSKDNEDFIERYLRLNHYFKELNTYSLSLSEKLISIKFNVSRKISRNVLGKLVKTGELVPVKGKGYVHSYTGLRRVATPIKFDSLTNINTYQINHNVIKNVVYNRLDEEEIKVWKKSIDKENNLHGICRDFYNGPKLIATEYGIINTPFYINSEYHVKEDICMFLAKLGRCANRIKQTVIYGQDSFFNDIASKIGYPQNTNYPLILTTLYENNDILISYINIVNPDYLNLKYTIE